jgi:hypothetical protein|tara:strand:- start:2100 stop:2312 length:213 start_codon:yes stop_codon:yes gene_type:complete
MTDSEWEKRQKLIDSVPTLRTTIASQEETISLLTTQLLNERLKNENLERIVTAEKLCSCLDINKTLNNEK